MQIFIIVLSMQLLFSFAFSHKYILRYGILFTIFLLTFGYLYFDGTLGMLKLLFVITSASYLGNSLYRIVFEHSLSKDKENHHNQPSVRVSVIVREVFSAVATVMFTFFFLT